MAPPSSRRVHVSGIHVSHLSPAARRSRQAEGTSSRGMLTGVHGQETPEAQPRGPLTRRALIGGSALIGAALVAAACSPSPSPEPSDSATPEPDADAQVRADVAAQESAIIALYDAVIAAHPALASDLSAIRDEHAAHAEAMGVTGPSAAPPVVGTQAEALAALSDAEKQAIAQRTAACEAASGADLARVTALIAASEAGHVEYLRGIA